MADAQDTAAEIKRLSAMSRDDLVDTVVDYVMGRTDPQCPREIQGQALASPQFAPRTLDALETGIKQARSFLPRREGESKREQWARLVPFRERLQQAMGPYQDVVDDLAHEEAKKLAALDDAMFHRRWTAFVLDEPVTGPVPRRVQALAFRSPRVAGRAEALCQLMFQEPARFLPSVPEESRKASRARVEAFRRRVASEARFLRYAVQYAEARHGRMPAEPNVRLEALRRLGQAHPEELSKLLHQVRAEARDAKAEQRREKRAVRRAEGRGAR